MHIQIYQLLDTDGEEIGLLSVGIPKENPKGEDILDSIEQRTIDVKTAAFMIYQSDWDDTEELFEMFEKILSPQGYIVKREFVEYLTV